MDTQKEVIHPQIGLSPESIENIERIHQIQKEISDDLSRMGFMFAQATQKVTVNTPNLAPALERLVIPSSESDGLIATIEESDRDERWKTDPLDLMKFFPTCFLAEEWRIAASEVLYRLANWIEPHE